MKAMIDIETLDVTSNAVIVSIGAVKFDNGRTYDIFSHRVDIDSCLRMGMSVSGSTIAWWMRQSDAARAQFQEDGAPLNEILSKLSKFVSGLEIWCNGAAFDVPILENAYRLCGLEIPWKYYEVRCYRTLVHHYKEVKLPAFAGTAHDPLDDALHQANCLNMILKEANASRMSP